MWQQTLGKDRANRWAQIKATGKLGRMINITCRPFLCPLLINHPALHSAERLLFLFTLKFFHVILFSSRLSHRLPPPPVFFLFQISFDFPSRVLFCFSCSDASAGEKARTFPLPLVSFLTLFLLLMTNNLLAPGNTNSFPFL